MTRPDLRATLLSHWRFKVAAGGVISAAFFAGYFALQHAHRFPVHTMPAIWIDRRIGFHPGLTVVYASLWLYMSIAPGLTADRGQLVRYATVVAGICGLGLVTFAAWPTAVVRPAHGGDPVFRLVTRFDGTVNACPSLHATFAAFSAGCVADVARRLKRPWPAHAANGTWCAAILYATLATKQHVAVDVLAGVPLGVVAWLAYRRPATGGHPS